MTTLTQSAQNHVSEKEFKLSSVRFMLHLEALGVLIAAVAVYFNQGFGTLTFFALLLAPDLAFLIYALDQKIGAFAYNLAHFVVFPAALIGVGIVGDWSAGIQFGLIWLSHITMDRSIGYGLKYSDEFKHTHLQNV